LRVSEKGWLVIFLSILSRTRLASEGLKSLPFLEKPEIPEKELKTNRMSRERCGGSD
jgi:hypothetical protein